MVRAELEPKGGYRWVDSTQRIGCTHLATNTRLRVISSNAKSAMGILEVWPETPILPKPSFS